MSAAHSVVRRSQNNVIGIMDWEAMSPVYHDDPGPGDKMTNDRTIKGHTYKCVGTWEYKQYLPHIHTGEPELRTLFWRARYEVPQAKDDTTKKKKFYMTWYLACPNDDNSDEFWTVKAPDAKLLPHLPCKKWPLYGSWLLAENPDAEVWVVEGEKCVDYVNNVLKPKNAVAVSPCVYGAVDKPQAAAAYDYSDLWDRTVFVWPDADPRGVRAGQLLCALNPDWLYIDTFTNAPVEGWDLADLDEHSVDWKQLRAGATKLKSVREAFERRHPDRDLMPKDGDMAHDGRIVIHWRPTQPEVAIDRALPVICEARNLYNMGGRVVRLGTRSLTMAYLLGSPETDAPPRLLPYEPGIEVMQSLINRSIEWGKVKHVSPTRANPEEYYKFNTQDTPQRVVKNLRGMNGDGLTPLVGVIDYPSFSRQGNILAGKGYDPETGLYLSTPRLGLKTDRFNTPKKAFEYLRDEVFCDVMFEGEPGSDERKQSEAMAICALLTLLVKKAQAITTPAFMITATTQQTGKTVLGNMLAMIALNTEAAAMAWDGSAEERRKQLLALGLENAPLVVFDNVPDYSIVECPHHAKAITSLVVSDRVLGVSRNQEVPSTWVVFFNGNNLELGTDFASRIGVIRLDAKAENPMDRTFKHKDPINYIAKNRKKILEAAFAILSYHHEAKDEVVGTKCRFGRWSTVVRDAVLRASGTDVWSEQLHGVRSEMDQAIADFLEVLEKHTTGLYNIDQKTVLSAKEILENTDLTNTLREVFDLQNSAHVREVMNASKAGKVMSRIKGKVLDGRRLGSNLSNKNTYFLCQPDGKFWDYAEEEARKKEKGNPQK